MVIPPDILKKILNKVTEDIKSNARLRLREDPKTNLWAYYGKVKLTPIILQDYSDCTTCRLISPDGTI